MEDGITYLGASCLAHAQEISPGMLGRSVRCGKAREKATPSHPRATPKPTQSHTKATLMRPSSHPRAAATCHNPIASYRSNGTWIVSPDANALCRVPNEFREFPSFPPDQLCQ